METVDLFSPFLKSWQEYNFNSLIKELSTELEFKDILENLNEKSDYLLLAKKLLKVNRLSESITICKKCVTLYPDSGEAYITLARCFWEYDDKERANLLLTFAFVCWENMAKKMSEDYKPSLYLLSIPDISSLTPTKSNLDNTSEEIADTYYDMGVHFQDDEEDDVSCIFYKLAILNNPMLWKAYANTWIFNL